MRLSHVLGDRWRYSGNQATFLELETNRHRNQVNHEETPAQVGGVSLPRNNSRDYKAWIC